ncbi:MAG: tRNA (guanosine(37)-N1)-methyltransferase TrmD [Lachnospiraceae bacterium]|jgi:tRNA (guanine37-N1)-methyltransferase|nr:tRNA (guanosine(37)-N1)-methyltransferase TrmD [Lachnospiraceae bacterium]
MKFYIMTLFPDMVMNGLNTSIIGKAMEKELLSIEAVDIRDYTLDKHRHVDDYPYGGGAGMVMQAQPVYDCFKDIEKNLEKKPRVLFMTPTGKTFNQDMAKELSQEENLVFLCGHYEGIDKRVLDKIVTDEVSIGDFVLTGGELPAMMMIDAISRLIPGVLNNDISAETESFTDNLLEYPQYTRPEVWEGEAVPAVLLSGHHANIEKWRREQSLLITKERRPDLFEKAQLTKKDKKFLAECE